MNEPIFSNLTNKNECPEGYYRTNACSYPSDPGYDSTFYSCGYPPQINCYTYTDIDGRNCVSYCDNV